jgi:hypothetical protein
LSAAVVTNDAVWSRSHSHRDICGLPSRSEPIPFVDIELHDAVVTHLQQQRLAIVLILYVYALHDFESFQRLFTKGN